MSDARIPLGMGDARNPRGVGDARNPAGVGDARNPRGVGDARVPLAEGAGEGEAEVPLGPRDLDALQEMATVGCGQGLTALGKLLRQRMDMDVPEAWVGRASGAIADFLGALGEELVAVGVRLEGLLSGHLVLLLPERDAERLASGLGYDVAGGDWSALAESAVLESGNIVGSAFVSAVARMIDARLLLSVPTLARGSGRACLDRLVDRDSGRVALATRFSTSGPGGLEGLILVIPELRRLPALLAMLAAA